MLRFATVATPTGTAVAALGCAAREPGRARNATPAAAATSSRQTSAMSTRREAGIVLGPHKRRLIPRGRWTRTLQPFEFMPIYHLLARPDTFRNNSRAG